MTAKGKAAPFCSKTQSGAHRLAFSFGKYLRRRHTARPHGPAKLGWTRLCRGNAGESA